MGTQKAVVEVAGVKVTITVTKDTAGGAGGLVVTAYTEDQTLLGTIQTTFPAPPTA